MKTNSIYKRIGSGEFYILEEIDGMFDVILLRGKDKSFTVAFDFFMSEFEKVYLTKDP
jgi:hypothetical protein